MVSGGDPLVLQQSPQQLQRRVLVAALLHQHIEDFALVVDRAPNQRLRRHRPHASSAAQPDRG